MLCLPVKRGSPQNTRRWQAARAAGRGRRHQVASQVRRSPFRPNTLQPHSHHTGAGKGGKPTINKPFILHLASCAWHPAVACAAGQDGVRSYAAEQTAAARRARAAAAGSPPDMRIVHVPDPEQWLKECQQLLAALQRQAAEPRCFVALAVYQQRQGLARRLDARGQRHLNLLLQQAGLKQAFVASTGKAQRPLLHKLEAVSRQLCAEQPASLACMYDLTAALQGMLAMENLSMALQACRAAVRAAHSQNGALLVGPAVLLMDHAWRRGVHAFLRRLP